MKDLEHNCEHVHDAKHHPSSGHKKNPTQESRATYKNNVNIGNEYDYNTNDIEACQAL